MLYHIPPDQMTDATNNGQMAFCWVVDAAGSCDLDGLCLNAENEHQDCVCVRIVHDKNQPIIQQLKYRTGGYCFLYQKGQPSWEKYNPSKKEIVENMTKCKDIRKNPKPPQAPALEKKTTKSAGNFYFSYKVPVRHLLQRCHKVL